MSLWRKGKEPKSTSLEKLDDHSKGVIWVDLESGGLSHSEVFVELKQHLRGLTEEMLQDLLDPDEEPKGKPYPDSGARLVSTFRVDAVERDPDAERRKDAFPGPGHLRLQPVELLAADGWLISCWHPQRTYNGIRPEKKTTPAEPCDPHREQVAIRWRDGAGQTSGDLGVLLMHELALSYAPVHRKLYDWLEGAELALYLTDHADQEALARLWAYMTLLRSWLVPLNVAGLRIEREKAWLPNVTDEDEVERVDDRIDRSLASLRSLATALRTAFSSVYSVEEQRGRDRKEETQRRIELIAAAFLVPTLVVGFYGANTWLPGQGSHTGKTSAFIEMATAIVLLTGVVVFLLYWWHRHQEQDLRRRNEQRRRMAELLKEPATMSADGAGPPSP